jgi:hypothetical protein
VIMIRGTTVVGGLWGTNSPQLILLTFELFHDGINHATPSASFLMLVALAISIDHLSMSTSILLLSLTLLTFNHLKSIITFTFTHFVCKCYMITIEGLLGAGNFVCVNVT